MQNAEECFIESNSVQDTTLNPFLASPKWRMSDHASESSYHPSTDSTESASNKILEDARFLEVNSFDKICVSVIFVYNVFAQIFEIFATECITIQTNRIQWFVLFLTI